MSVLLDAHYCIINAEVNNAGWANNLGTNAWYPIDDMPLDNNNLVGSYFYQTPVNFVYVDGMFSGTENGSLSTPYNTIAEGQNAIPVHDWQTNPKGGRLWIKAGSYFGSGNYPITIQKPMEISSYWGDVDIGGKLHLKHSGSIRLPANNGTLRIQ
jgi:hypothetical protein